MINDDIYSMRIYKLIAMLLEEHRTGHEIMTELQISRNQFYRVKDKMKEMGIHPIYDPSTQTYSLNRNIVLDKVDAEIISRLNKLGLNRKQIDRVLEAFSADVPSREPLKLEFSDLHVKFGVIADLHVGSKYYRSDVLQHAIENFRRNEVQFVLNCGDTIEGMSNREGHIFELDTDHGIGVTAQAGYLAQEFQGFEDIGLDVYSIEAQGSHGGWSYNRANQGLEIGHYLAVSSKPYKFLGYDEHDLLIEGLKVRLRHPMKKHLGEYISSLPGGHKPHMIFQGHYHGKVGYEFVRNVHGYDCPTMQDQSPFLSRMSAPSLVGYWIVEVSIGEAIDGSMQTRLGSGKYIESVKNQLIPFYD